MGVSFLVASANVCIYIPRGFTTAGRQLLYTQGSTPMHALFLLGAGQKHTRYLRKTIRPFLHTHPARPTNISNLKFNPMGCEYFRDYPTVTFTHFVAKKAGAQVLSLTATL